MPTIHWTLLAHMIRLICLALLLAAAQPAAAQVADAGQEPPLVEAKNLETLFFTPKFLDLRELYSLANELYGRDIYLVDRGGYGQNPVRNLQRLGNTLIVYDLNEQGQLIGEALHALDAQAESESKAGVSEVVISEWTPGYISMGTAMSALENLKRIVQTVDDRGTRNEAWNITQAKERSVLVLRDTPQRVALMTDLLKRLDVPEPQLLISCLVIRGVTEPADDGVELPAELTEHLRKLVPFDHFDILSQGMVRSSARAHSIELSIDGFFALELRPEAFDTATRSLTTACQFVGGKGFGFETRTTVAAGEYTVLGATGREPIFAVLRIQLLD